MKGTEDPAALPFPADREVLDRGDKYLVLRERTQLGGRLWDQVAEVLEQLPATDDAGLTVRQAPATVTAIDVFTLTAEQRQDFFSSPASGLTISTDRGTTVRVEDGGLPILIPPGGRLELRRARITRLYYAAWNVFHQGRLTLLARG